MMKIAIVGGGISGLAAAYELQQAGAEFVLYERAPRFGGVICTDVPGDFIVEGGPDSFLTEKPAARELIVELGLESELLHSNDAQRKTYILLDGELVPIPDGLQFFVPTNLWALAMSDLFPFKAQLRIFREWFERPRSSESDESVAGFVTRHFGREMVDRLADPLLAGVYGGTADELSVNAVLPRMVEMERTKGSLIRAMLAARKKMSGASRPPLFTSLRGGLQTLVDGIVKRLPSPSLHARTTV